MCFKQKGSISTQSGKPRKLVDQFTHLGSNISSTEVKVWNVTERLLIIWKSEVSDKIKWNFFQSVAVSMPMHPHKC